MAIELAKSIDEELVDMKTRLKARAQERGHQYIAECAYYGGLVVCCRVQHGRVHGKPTYVSSWLVDGKPCGFNAMRGALRKAGVL